MTMPSINAQEIVERCLDLSEADGSVVLVDEGHSANLRWAGNTLTTNGVMRSRSVTVVAMVGEASGTASGVVARSAVTPESLEPLVRSAEQAARDNGPAQDAQPLVDGAVAPSWTESPGETSVAVFADIAPALGDSFARANAEDRRSYG